MKVLLHVADSPGVLALNCVGLASSHTKFSIHPLLNTPFCPLLLRVIMAGPPVDVWAAVETLRKCHDIDVPDVPARAFNDGKGLAHMIVGATGAHTMVGPSILNQTRQCQYSWNQTADPNPADFVSEEHTHVVHTLMTPVVFWHSLSLPPMYTTLQTSC